MIRRFFWEFPLTASVVVLIAVSYILILFFVPGIYIKKYFLSYPGQMNPVNWFLSLFFHSGPSHLISNLLFLFFIGRTVEWKLGKGKWLLFFFMSAFISSFLDSLIRGYVYTERNLPSVGASGAISGIGAVSALVSPFSMKILGKTIPFPVFIISWIVLYTDLVHLFSNDHINHWAHLAGFSSVFFTAYFLNPLERMRLRTAFLLNLVFFVLSMILIYFINEM